MVHPKSLLDGCPWHTYHFMSGYSGHIYIYIYGIRYISFFQLYVTKPQAGLIPVDELNCIGLVNTCNNVSHRNLLLGASKSMVKKSMVSQDFLLG